MKLVGVYLSPYVRRVAAAMISRGLPYEHEPVNRYREVEIASRYNPVAKVPSLVLDAAAKSATSTIPIVFVIGGVQPSRDSSRASIVRVVMPPRLLC